MIRPLQNDELGGLHRWIARIVIVSMALLLVGTLAFDAAGWESETKRLKIDLWKAPSSEEVFDGRAGITLGDNLRNVSRARQEGAHLWANFLARGFNHFHKAITGGEGEWLFLRDRLKSRFKDSGTINRDLDFSAGMLACLDRRLDQYGTKLTLMFLPRKGVVCENYLGDNRVEGGQLYRLLMERLRPLAVESPDLLSPLLTDPQVHWLSRNTHWSEQGARVAARATAESIGHLVLEEDRPLTYEVVTRLMKEDIAKAGLLVRRTKGLFDLSEERWTQGLRWRNRKGRVLSLNALRSLNSAPNVLIGTSFSKSYPVAMSLTHYTGLQIHDLSVASIGPVIPLGNFLQTQRVQNGEVERLFWEVPGNFLFTFCASTHHVTSLPNALVNLPPRHLTRIASAGEVPEQITELSLRFDERALARGLVAVKGRELLTSGDGVAVYKFKRRANKDIHLRYVIPGIHWPSHAIWKSAQEEITLPVLGAGPGRSTNLLMVGGPKVAPTGPIKGISLHIDGAVNWSESRAPDAVATHPITGVHSAVWREAMTWEKLRSLVLRCETTKPTGALRFLRIGVILPDGKPGVLYEESGNLPLPKLAVLSAGKFTGKKVAAIAVQAVGDRSVMKDLQLVWAKSR